MARGLYLDFDGTVADTMPILRAAYEAFLTDFRVTPTDEEFSDLIGPPLREVVAVLRHRYALGGDLADLYERYLRAVGERYADAPPTPGTRELLVKAAALGRRVAIVTSAGSDTVGNWLARHDLARLVTAIVGSGDCSGSKPSPDPYRAALRRTGCGASESLAVEDSLPGLRSAMGAGIPTVLVSADHPGRGTIESPLYLGAVVDLVAVTDLLD